ncbi:MAG: DNA internalization-related competence protein ComEC/Rec2 [Oscillospiraceae bacterium]|nr:DNA internalization-related competence protein ComEC/Rec2 [Oscillospiraceae bacterium]
MEVKEFPRETMYGTSLIVKLKLDHAPDPEVCLYAGPEALELQPGDTVSASVKLSRSDFRRGESYDYYQSLGIYLTGNVQGELSLLTRPAHMPFRYWPQLAAKSVKNTIRLLFPLDLSGFFTALLMGDKSFLPDGLYAALRRSGAAHIVAVSGLHISFLSGLFSALFRRKNRFTALLHILVLFFFVAMTGNSYSSLRAAFMASAVLLAPLAGREDDRLTTLFAALFVLLVLCPYSASSIGLQLSFAALLGIILITDEINGRLQAILPNWTHPLGVVSRKALRFLFSTLSVTLGATLFTLPLVAIHYRSVSLVAPLTNLVILWAVSLAFVFGLLGALSGTILPFAGWALARLAAWPARWVIWVARGISHWPFASLSLLSGYLILWFIVAYGTFALWLLSGGRVRFWIPGITLTLTLCAALLVQAYPTLTSRLTVTVLDVGQGSATLLYSKGHAVLVDCGGNKDNAGDIAADQIQSLGLSNLDALILTHYDSDHSNGVSELMERLTVSRVILPNVDINSVSRQNILALCQAHSCDVSMLYTEDFSTTMGDTELNIYIPMGSTTSNTVGLSVLCSAGSFDLLITGDMDAVTERRLMKYKALPDIELLLVGHHGSKNATSWELLESTRPEMAVISVGYNPYGHPSNQTMARLAAAGCEIYRTDWMGNVTFHISNP